MIFTFGSTRIDFDARPCIMGVVNVTPDSFSDGGKFFTVDDALRHARQLIEEGADILDIGGESSRPGAEPVSLEEELRRTIPVIEDIARHFPAIPVSIDTYKSAVAARAIDAGATIVNDISAATFDPAMAATCAANGASMVLMHMQGTPRTMQQSPQYDDVVDDVRSYLADRAGAVRAAGVAQVMLDVGIGFGKTLAHNLALLRRLHEFHTLDAPLVLGVSRKSFIGTILNGALPDARLFGTAAAVTRGVLAGAQILRVHDVRAMREAATVAFALRG